MLEMLLRLETEAGPAATWVAMVLAALVAVFVLYVGVAMWATLRASDPERAKACYRVFQDLLGLFRFRGHK
jgi:hypothetical protein